MATKRDIEIASLLFRNGIATQDEIQSALGRQGTLLTEGTVRSLVDILVERKILPEDSAATFSEAVEPIFTATCASVRCHSGPSQQNGLDLSAGNAFGNTVGVPSTDVPAMNRITAGDPLRS